MAAFLKKIGFAKVDGSPSEIYTRFRNDSSIGEAAAEALLTGYAPLSIRNEYWHALDDAKLRGLIIEETGEKSGSPIVGYILGSIKGLKKFATFDKTSKEATKAETYTPTLSIAAGLSLHTPGGPCWPSPRLYDQSQSTSHNGRCRVQRDL